MLTAVQSIVEVIRSPEVQGDVHELIEFFNADRQLCTQEDIDLLTQFMESLKWVSEHWNIQILLHNVIDFIYTYFLFKAQDKL